VGSPNPSAGSNPTLLSQLYNNEAMRTAIAAAPKTPMPAMRAVTRRRNHWRRCCCSGVSSNESTSSVMSGDGPATTMADTSGAAAHHPSKNESSTSARASSDNGGSAAGFAAAGSKLAGARAGAGPRAPGAAAAAVVRTELLAIAFGTTASTGSAFRRCCLRWLLSVPLRRARSECCFLARLDMMLSSPGQGRFEVPLFFSMPTVSAALGRVGGGEPSLTFESV
jgi:hypothetical protein